MTPGESHIVRRTHLCPLWSPGQLILVRLPSGLCGNRGLTQNSWAAVVERNCILREPAAEGPSSPAGNRLRKATLKLKQKQSPRCEGRLRERVCALTGNLRDSVHPQTPRSVLGNE